jgi:hypothetical protein
MVAQRDANLTQPAASVVLTSVAPEHEPNPSRASPRLPRRPNFQVKGCLEQVSRPCGGQGTHKAAEIRKKINYDYSA